MEHPILANGNIIPGVKSQPEWLSGFQRSKKVSKLRIYIYSYIYVCIDKYGQFKSVLKTNTYINAHWTHVDSNLAEENPTPRGWYLNDTSFITSANWPWTSTRGQRTLHLHHTIYVLDVYDLVIFGASNPNFRSSIALQSYNQTSFLPKHSSNTKHQAGLMYFGWSEPPIIDCTYWTNPRLIPSE